MSKHNPYISQNTASSPTIDGNVADQISVDPVVLGLLDLQHRAPPSDTKHLKVLPQRLFFLDRSSPYLYKTPLSSMLTQFKNLVSLDLSRVRDLSDEDVRVVVNTHLHLQDFAFEGCPKVTKAAIGSISCGKCTGLKTLSCSIPDLPAALLIICISSQKKLKHLRIPNYGCQNEAQWEGLIQKRPGLVIEYLPDSASLAEATPDSLPNLVKQVMCRSKETTTIKVSFGNSGDVKEIEYVNDAGVAAYAMLTQDMELLDKTLPFLDQESIQHAVAEMIQILGLKAFTQHSWSAVFQKLIGAGFHFSFDIVASSTDLAALEHFSGVLDGRTEDQDFVIGLEQLLCARSDFGQTSKDLQLNTHATIKMFGSGTLVASLEMESDRFVLKAEKTPEPEVVTAPASPAAEPVDLNDPNMTGEKLFAFLSKTKWDKDTFSSLLHIWSNNKGDSKIWKYANEDGDTLLHLICKLKDPYLKSPDSFPLLQSFLTLAIGVENPESTSAKNKLGRVPLAEALIVNSTNCINFLWSLPNLPQVRMDADLVFSCVVTHSEKILNSLFQSTDIHQKFDEKEADKVFPGAGIVSCELIHFLTKDQWALEQLISMPGADINTKALIKDPVTADASSMTVLEFALATDAPRETIKFLFLQQGTARKSFIIIWIQKQLKKIADMESAKDKEAHADRMEDLLYILPQQVVANLAPKFSHSSRFVHSLIQYGLTNTSLFSRLLAGNVDLSLEDDNGETVFHILARNRDLSTFVRCMKSLSSKEALGVTTPSLETPGHVLLSYLMEDPDKIEKDLFADFLNELKRLGAASLLTKPDAFEMDPITITIAATIIRTKDFEWDFSWFTKQMIDLVKTSTKPGDSPLTMYKRTSLHGLTVSFPAILVTLGPKRQIYNMSYPTWTRLFELITSNQWYVDHKVFDSFSRSAMDYVFDPVGESDMVENMKRDVHYNHLKSRLIRFGFQETKPVPKIDDVFGAIANGEFTRDLLAFLGRHGATAFETDGDQRVAAHAFAVYADEDIRQSSRDCEKWLSHMGYTHEKKLPAEPVDRWGWTPFSLSILKDSFHQRKLASSAQDSSYYEGHKSQMTLEFQRCAPRLDASRDPIKGRTTLFRLLENLTIVDFDKSEHLNLKNMTITANVDRVQHIILALMDVGHVDINSIDQSGDTALDYLQSLKRNFSSTVFKKLERVLKRLGARTGEEMFFKLKKDKDTSTVTDSKASNRSSNDAKVKDSWTPRGSVSAGDDLRSRLESRDGRDSRDSRDEPRDKKRSYSPDARASPPAKSSRTDSGSPANSSPAGRYPERPFRGDHYSPGNTPTPRQLRGTGSRTSTPLPPEVKSRSGSTSAHVTGTKRSIFSETLDARSVEPGLNPFPFPNSNYDSLQPLPSSDSYIYNGNGQATAMVATYPQVVQTLEPYGHGYYQGPSATDAELFRQCEGRNETEIVALVRGGASLTVQDNRLRMPLHVLCTAIADSGRHNPNVIRTAEMLFDPSNATVVLNHLDSSLMTPLSMMLLSDVYQWLQSAGRRWKSPSFQNVVVNPSPLTRFLLESGATLNVCASDTSETAWHGLAHMMFSSFKDAVIPGFPQKDMEARHVYLILKQFIQFGNLNVHVRDRAGRTGMDVFRMRFESKTLQLTEGEYRLVCNDLADLNC